MREFTLFAPSDCIVSNTAAENDHALQQIKTVLKGNVAASTRLAFRRAKATRGRNATASRAGVRLKPGVT